MAVAIKFIKPLDIESPTLTAMDPTKSPDKVCLLEAAEWDFLIKFSFIVHVMLCLTNIYREIFSAQTNMFGQFMRLVEIACIPIYFYQILTAIELMSVAMIRQETTDPLNKYIMGTYKRTDPEIGSNDSGRILEVKCPLDKFTEFSGRAVEWYVIEIAVFGFFLMTMLLTMMKSRFISVGTDNSG